MRSIIAPATPAMASPPPETSDARPSSFVVPSRDTARRIQSFIATAPELGSRYARAKEFRRILRQVSNFDLTSRCNLRCEGCFYFEGDDYKQATEQEDLARWQAFFEDQARRGVTFASIAGAEPALEQDRLQIANRCIPRGVIFTNGTIKIRPSINYSIVISIWGDAGTTEAFRGGGVFWKALKTHKGDRRARALFMVHAKNIGQISEVTRIVSDHGIRLSFNYFSPTNSYLEKLAAESKNDDEFFRISSKEDNFLLTPDALERARDAIDDMIDLYPETVFHTHAFNRVCTNPTGLYDVDPDTGIATNCGGRNFQWHQSYRVDLKPSNAKCCTPNVNCKDCRLNAVALASLLFRLDRFVGSIQEFRDWLDICEQYGRSNLLDTDPVWSVGMSRVATLHQAAHATPQSHRPFQAPGSPLVGDVPESRNAPRPAA
jgi:MoaA/NifB/PqqE/SkfB family radical SAM enzyme